MTRPRSRRRLAESGGAGWEALTMLVEAAVAAAAMA